jgi:transposase-like protein
VRLAISDAHSGLQAILIEASWQRCRVHVLRNVLAQAPKGSAEMVAAAWATVNRFTVSACGRHASSYPTRQSAVWAM